MKRIVVLFLLFFFISPSILMAQEKRIKFGLEDLPPYAFQEGEKLAGIFPDLVQAAFKDSGFSLSMEILPPKRSALWSEEGRLDGVVGVASDISLFEGEIVSEVFYTSTINPIILRETKISYKTIEDLKPYKIGIVAGIGFEEAFPMLKFESVTLSESNIKKLFAKRFKLIIEDPVIFNYLVKNKYSQYQNLYQVLSPPFLEVDLVIGFSSNAPDYKEKLETFNKGIDLMKRNGIYDKIIKKWTAENSP